MSTSPLTSKGGGGSSVEGQRGRSILWCLSCSFLSLTSLPGRPRAQAGLSSVDSPPSSIFFLFSLTSPSLAGSSLLPASSQSSGLKSSGVYGASSSLSLQSSQPSGFERRILFLIHNGPHVCGSSRSFVKHLIVEIPRAVHV